jgi:predicted Fe-Mo cluster-binding NifX family protein
MKILFSATGKNWEDSVDERFGRAKGFVLYDEGTNQLSWLSNYENVDAEHGAGIKAAQLVLNTGADILIIGRIGPKAYDILKKTNLEIYKAENISLKQAYKDLQEGILNQIK